MFTVSWDSSHSYVSFLHNNTPCGKALHYKCQVGEKAEGRKKKTDTNPVCACCWILMNNSASWISNMSSQTHWSKVQQKAANEVWLEIKKIQCLISPPLFYNFISSLVGSQSAFIRLLKSCSLEDSSWISTLAADSFSFFLHPLWVLTSPKVLDSSSLSLQTFFPLLYFPLFLYLLLHPSTYSHSSLWRFTLARLLLNCPHEDNQHWKQSPRFRPIPHFSSVFFVSGSAWSLSLRVPRLLLSSA